jgi:hypothetical protein
MKPRVLPILLAFFAASGQPSRSAESKPAPSANQLELVRQYARQRGGQPEALAQLIQLARGCDDATTVELIDQLAASHYRAGNLEIAAATRRAIVEN